MRLGRSLEVEVRDRRLADRRQTPSRDDLISIAFLIDDGVTLSPHCRLPESGLPRAAPRRMVR